MADGKERQMLDIGIMLGIVGDNVMNLTKLATIVD